LLLQIEYKDLGGAECVQIWDVRGPQCIREDWRPGERFRAELALPKEKWNTLEGMLFNVGLITNFASSCRHWFNERLDAKKVSSDADWWKPTTTGEVVKSWGYHLALALNPSVPVDQAWQTEKKPGDLSPPLEMGQHGMHKNRYSRFRELQAMMFSKDECDLDSCTRPIPGATAVLL